MRDVKRQTVDRRRLRQLRLLGKKKIAIPTIPSRQNRRRLADRNRLSPSLPSRRYGD
jgi:hypothetical protein